MGDALVYFRYVLLAMAAAGIVGLFVLRALRKRALSKSEAARWKHGQPAPWSGEEFGSLLRWQRKIPLTALAVFPMPGHDGRYGVFRPG